MSDEATRVTKVRPAGGASNAGAGRSQVHHAVHPSLKQLLLTDDARGEIPVPKRGQLWRTRAARRTS